MCSSKGIHRCLKHSTKNKGFFCTVIPVQKAIGVKKIFMQRNILTKVLSLWAATPAALMWKLVCEYMKYRTGLCPHMILLGLEVSGITVTGCETAWERPRNPNAPEEGAELCSDAPLLRWVQDGSKWSKAWKQGNQTSSQLFSFVIKLWMSLGSLYDSAIEKGIAGKRERNTYICTLWSLGTYH